MSDHGQIFSTSTRQCLFLKKQKEAILFIILSFNVFLFEDLGQVVKFQSISVGIVTCGSTVQKINECNKHIVKTEKTIQLSIYHEMFTDNQLIMFAGSSFVSRFFT